MAETHMRFVWNTLSAIGGLIGGLGIALLLQQFAVFPLSITLFVVGALVGLALGILMPTIVLGFMMMRPAGRAT